MLRIAAAHLLRDRRPAAAPEAGQVARGLDRPAGRRGQASTSGTVPPATVGMVGEAEQRLDAHRRPSARPRPHSRSHGGCRPASRNGSGASRSTALRPSQPSSARARRQARRDRPRRAGACRRAGPAAIRRASARSAASDRSAIAGSKRAGEGGAAAQRAGGLAPGQQVETVRRARLRAGPPRSRPDRRGCPARRRAGSRRAAGRAWRAPRRWRDRRRPRRRSRSGRRTGSRPSPGRSARRRGCARPAAAPPTSATASQASRASGEAGSSRKPRPPTLIQSAPVASRRFARRSGKASATQAPTCVSTGVRRASASPEHEQARQRLRQPARRLGAPALLAAPAAQAQLQIGVAAAEAALGQQHRDLGRGRAPAARLGLDQHMGEARRQRQSRRSPGHARSAGRPRRARRATAAAAAPRRSPRPAADRASAARADRRRPRSRSRAASADRSASRISGGSKRGRPASPLPPTAGRRGPAPAARRGRRAGSPRPGWRAR